MLRKKNIQLIENRMSTCFQKEACTGLSLSDDWSRTKKTVEGIVCGQKNRIWRVSQNNLHLSIDQICFYCCFIFKFQNIFPKILTTYNLKGETVSSITVGQFFFPNKLLRKVYSKSNILTVSHSDFTLLTNAIFQEICFCH